MFKKALPIFLSVSLLVGLTACTSEDKKLDTNGNRTDSFSAPVKDIKTLPYFDQELKGLGLGVWGEGNLPDPRKLPETNPNPTATPEGTQVGESEQLDPNAPLPPVVDPVLTDHPDTILFFNINLNDTSTGCKMTGQISYLDTYLASRGDSFNSSEQLYNLPPASENPVSDMKEENIHDVTYATGKYTTPAEWGTNEYHKTAVRVFGNPVPRENVSTDAVPETGNWNSDTANGLPIVTIDFSCPTEADLTDARWEDGVKWFSLVFNETNPYSTTQSPPTDLPAVEETDIPSTSGK